MRNVEENRLLARKALPDWFGTVLVSAGVLAGLIGVSLVNYLLFHALAELFSIVIAWALFILAWNTRERTDNHPLVVLGIAYLFIAFLDLLHTLSYEGMSIFESGYFFANQLWVISRGLEAAALLGFALLMRRPMRLPYPALFASFGLASAVGVLCVFVWKTFPVCFVAGIGQTPFKIAAEWIIIAGLLAALALLPRDSAYFDRRIYLFTAGSILLTAVEEIFFTLYVSNFALQNILGHLTKIASFFLIYKAILETGLLRPFDLIFKKLKDSEARLREAVATKDRFFSIIAHDLRNPIGGIAVTTEQIHRDPVWLNGPDGKEIILQLMLAARHTSHLLENLLSWSLSQANRLETRPEPLELLERVNSVLPLFQGPLRQKAIALNVSIPAALKVLADPDMTLTIARNLISNAVKFSRPGGHIDIEAYGENGTVALRVRDEGIGMTRKQLDTLFQPDRASLSKGTAGESGSGLGLGLCRDFVERNKGSISVESVPDRGATVTIRLPRAKE
jgi:signal transduction histidine kinase